MVRLHVTNTRQKPTTTTTTTTIIENHNNNNNNGALNNNSVGHLNSNASSELDQQPPQPPRSTGGIVMVVPQQQQQQQQTQQSQQHAGNQQLQLMQSHLPTTQQQQHSPSDGSVPGSPPLIQQTAIPPQGAQLVPPVCAVHHPQQHQQQLAIVAAMHQVAAAHLAANSGTAGPGIPIIPHMQHAQMPPQLPPPPTTAATTTKTTATTSNKQQQHIQENGHHNSGVGVGIGSNGAGSAAGAGLSPNGSTSSSIGSSSASSSGSIGMGGGGGGGNNGGTLMTSAPPTGPLFIQYPGGDFYPAEYYIAPHPHEGICPQHPHHHHHHHQTMCAMPTEYGKQLNEHNESDEQDIMYANVGFYYSPTTVQMVSQNRPTPLPVPVQVGPQGQAVMQQYVNESGTLTHVVLSPQQYQQLHTGQGHIHAPFLTTNGTSHFFSPIPAAAFQPGPGGAGHTHYHAMTGGHAMTTQQQSSASQQQQQQAQPAQNMSHSPHSPSPPNSSYHKDERSQRQHTKLLRKLEKQRELNSAMSTPAHSPSPRRNEINGHHHKHMTNTNHNVHSHHNQQQQQQQLQQLPPNAQQQQQHLQIHLNNSNNNHHGRRMLAQRNGGNNIYQTVHSNVVANDMLNVETNVGGASSVGTSEDGEDNSSIAEDDEDFQASIVEQLSAIQKPEVCDLTSRSAKIMWEAPTITDALLINTRDLRYNVLLSDRAKDCKYKSLYKGDSYDCIVQDLQPGQEYVVRLQVHYEKLQGVPSEPTEFTTPPCEPDQPLPPKLTTRTKNSLQLRWTSPNANGAPIQQYLLEYDEGKTSNQQKQSQQQKILNFVEVGRIKGKQYMLSKLQPSTVYNFRLAAINEMGTSPYSSICSYSTSGNPPTAPKPPTLQAVSSSSLRLVWERREHDVDFVLQMLDRSTGHGYLNVYNGTCSYYECCQLRRATAYQFRLRAENEAGQSGWSSEVSFNTQPERPARPGKPHAKGKIHGTHFKVRWDPPLDTGGAEILRYFLELTSGAKFERAYVGSEAEAICDRVQPGTTYQLRVACEGPVGMSPYSEVAHITSEAIVPAAPPPPYYDSAPGPYAAVLHLHQPDYNGGAPILEFELQLRHPNLLHDEHGNNINTPIVVYRGKETHCIVQDLQPGQSYEVQVRALNRIGAGAWSSWFRFAAAAAPPMPPPAPKVAIKSATHLCVSWQEPATNGAAITEYRLESACLESAEATPASSDFHACYQGVQTSADLRNLLPHTMYHFRLFASNVAGTSASSPLVHARTPAAVPGAPHIKDYEFTATEVTLTWSEPDCHGAPISAYNIEYADGSISTPNALTEYTVNKLLPETAYKFRVQAINAVGAGPYSAHAKFTTLPLPPMPPKLECTGVGHNFIKLKWGDGKNLDFSKYYVEMYVQRAKEFQVVYTGTSCMCKVNKLQERTAYIFRICACTDRAGVGDYSKDVAFSTTAALPGNIKAPRLAFVGGACLLAGGHGGSGANNNYNIPSALLPETPTSFIAGLGNLSLGVPHTLEWQTAKCTFNDRVEYMLQYSIGKDTEFKQIYKGPETKFTIENLQPGVTYQFRVCPLRVTNSGDEFAGQMTTAFRYTVPQLPNLDDIDSSVLSTTAVNMLNYNNNNNNSISNNNNNNNLSNINSDGTTNCLGHSHTHYHHAHNHHLNHSQQQQQQQQSTSNAQRSLLASNSNNSNGDTTGILPLTANDLTTAAAVETTSTSSSNFTGCDDPNHLHHHHHLHHASSTNHNSIGNNDTTTSTTTTTTVLPSTLIGTTNSNNLRQRTGSNSSNSRNHHHNNHNNNLHASLLAATANTLLAHHNPLLIAAAAAAAAASSSSSANASSSNHHAHSHNHFHHNHAQQQQHGAIKRYVQKLTSVYTNRKRFSDQEKAVIFMVSFLFFTFLFATIVKMFIR